MSPFARLREKWFLLWMFAAVLLLGIALIALPQRPTVWPQTSSAIADFGNHLFVTATRIGPTVPAPVGAVFESSLTDLATAQKELPFEIKQPRYLPRAFTLVSVRKVDNHVDEVGVQLSYQGDSNEVIITETRSRVPVHIYVERDRILQQLDLNGYLGILYDPGGPPGVPVQRRAILQWTDGARWFEIRGSVGFDEMARIAQSIESH
jgi:hypothetical protein